MSKNKLLRGCRMYVGGYDISGDSREFGSLANGFGEVDNHGWGDTVRFYLADGIRTVGIDSYTAMLNDATGRSHDALKTVPGTADVALAVGAGGAAPAAGDPAYILPGVQLSGVTDYGSALGIITANWRRKAGATGTTSYDNPWGVVLFPLTSVSTTSNGSSVDNGASSANGFSAVLQVTATSSGDFAIIIEHSPDNSAWATLATFTSDASAIGSEFQSGTGTVNRYLRVGFTRTAGTISAFVALARNYR